MALAVGRRSRLPVVRVVSTAYIELIRAVPLITILFMAQFLFPLVLPDGLRIDNVIRAIGGITLFSAAYVAENVRGGLQAIPAGQHRGGLRHRSAHVADDHLHRAAAGAAHHHPRQRGPLHQPA